MQLDQFYLSILNLTVTDALVIGAGAAMLLSTYIGIMIARRETEAFSWLLGGALATAAGTIFGYVVMNAIGSIVAWSGSSIEGLAGADLTEWVDTLAVLFAPVQMHAVGLSLMGALLGIGLGYGIGSYPADTSRLGNLIGIIGVIIIVTGLMCMLMPSFITYTYDVAFTYLALLNGLILLCYGIRAAVIYFRGDSTSEKEESTIEELID